VTGLKVRRCGYALGAEITGVDASRPLDERTIEQIRQAWLDHIVVYLPGQNLSPKEFVAFCGQFGELDVSNTRPINHHPAHPEIYVGINKPVTIDGKQTNASSYANQWHSDYSHSAHPSDMTFLLAKELPDIGGDTMFANQYMAYDTLSPAFQKILDSLSAVHDITLGSSFTKRSPEQQTRDRKLNPPYVQAAVKTHPETGRRALFVAKRVRCFEGMTEDESMPILDFLNQHATRYEFIYRHRWTPHDLVMWDNRCVIHYAVQDYDHTQLRYMLRCSTVGPKSGYPYATASHSNLMSVN
jgi:taurine dioxygenase